MLTGARCGEARTATFDQFNLDLAIWTKQAAYTKQRRVHRVPISHEAIALIRLRGDAVPKGCPFLFPGDVPGQRWLTSSDSGSECAFRLKSPTSASTICATPSPRCWSLAGPRWK